jgi:alkanesulfonate monooxygenase SsuD/methylene tetrahydromethanopterin reductase-like flavin-dependent oxidoreductase (luciferase family)
MRIEVQIEPEGATFNEILDVAIWCDQVGVDAVYVWDHVEPLKTGGENFECWVTLGAIAARTFTTRVGSLVSAIPFRSVSMLAYQARTLNGISHGRAVLGVGAGWHEPDFQELGIPFWELSKRMTHLEASLPVLRKKTQGIPIVIGGGSSRAVRMAAEHADIYHSFGEPEVLNRRYDDLVGYSVVRFDRSPRQIQKSVGLKPRDIERMEEYRNVGVDVFTLSVKPASFSASAVLDWINKRDEEATLLRRRKR